MPAHWFLLSVCVHVAGGVRNVKVAGSANASLGEFTGTGSSSTKYREYSKGTTACQSGDRQMTSSSECKTAASDLGTSYDSSGSWGNVPGGCFRGKGGRFWFNSRLSSRTSHHEVNPVCFAAASAGLSPAQFAEWMQVLQNNDIPQGGYACGYSVSADGQQWCGCSCGHNQGNTTPCTLPPMNPGTAGGHTCGYYGVLFGCAEAHNTWEGCPRTSGR